MGSVQNSLSLPIRAQAIRQLHRSKLPRSIALPSEQTAQIRRLGNFERQITDI